MNDNKIHELVEINKEILKWIKLLAIPSIKLVLDDALRTDDEKRVFQLSDGKSSNEIASMVDVSPRTVLNYWSKWAEMGIVAVCPKYKKRYCRSFSLKEIGIDVPNIGVHSNKEDNADE